MPKCDFNKVARKFIEIALYHRRSPVNFLHIFRTPLYKNTSGGLLLNSKRFERFFISFFNLTPEIVTKSIYYIIWIINKPFY